MFSLSTMSAVIGILCGALDAWQILPLLLCSAGTILCGWHCEAFPGPGSRHVRALGWALFSLLWAIKLALVLRNADSVPGFVWAIMVVLFLLESSFGAVDLVTWRSYAHTEYAYGALSLLAKQSLAWMTIRGVLSLPDDAE
jgi:exosortase/archaeosortase